MKNIKFFLLGILFLSSLLFFTAKTVRADLVITWTTPPNSTSSDPNPSGTWTSTGGYIDVHFIANGADYTWAGTTTVTNPTHSQKGVVLLRLSYDWFDKFGVPHHVANALYNRYNYTSGGGDISIPLAGGVSIATCGNNAEAYFYIDYQIFPVPPGVCPTGYVSSDGICVKASTVIKPTPAVTCSAAPNPSPTNSAVNFTSTVSNAGDACSGNTCAYSWTNSFTAGDTSSNTCTGPGTGCSAAFLTGGTKTATVTVTNVFGSTSANCQVTVVPPPAVTCSAAPNPSPINSAVNFTSTVSNAGTACPGNSCAYSWTNDCTGASSTCLSEPYTTFGVKTATVTVTNIAGSASADCPVTVFEAPTGVTCSASPNPTPLGATATFSSAVTNNAAACPGTVCSYSWAGVPSDWLLLYANPNTCKAGGSTAASCSVKFLTVGVKTAKVTVTNIAGSATSAPCSTTSFVDCSSGFLSDGICVKATTGSPVIITPGTNCPSGSVLSDGICVKSTTISSALACPAIPVNPLVNQSVIFSLAGFTCPPSQTCGYLWTNTWSGTDTSLNTCKTGSGGSTANNCSAAFLSAGIKTARITATTSASGNFGPIDCPVTVTSSPPEITQVDSSDPLTVPPFTAGTFSTDYCSGSIFFGWTYLDTAGNNEKSFEMQVSHDPNFGAGNIDFDYNSLSSSPNLDKPSGTVNNQSVFVKTSPGFESNRLSYNTTYSWRVKVYDSTGLDSNWVVAGQTFTTPLHAYPSPVLTVSPSSAPLANNVDNVSFIDSSATSQSTCYNKDGTSYLCNSLTPAACTAAPSYNGTKDCYAWWFDYAHKTTPDDFTIGSINNPPHPYTSVGNYLTRLQICDDVGCCSTPGSVTVKSPLSVPEWKEISPF